MRFHRGDFARRFFFGATFLLCQLALTTAAQPLPTKWEYQVLDDCPSPPSKNWVGDVVGPSAKYVDLQQLGEDGWELVKVEDTISRDGAYDCRRYFLKRVKTSSSLPLRQAAPVDDPIYPKCLLRSDKAPVVQGLRLGMKKEEVLKLFKFSGAAARPVVNDPNQLPDEIEYGGLEPLTPVKNPEVRASVTLFEDELIRYRINYEFDHTWNWTLKEWKKKVTATYALPEIAWDEITTDDQTSYQMKCRDFTVETSFTGVTDHLQIQVTSLTGQAKVKKAREAFWQAKRQDFKP
ncbi:MAG: hypothetical protein HOP19_03215 [Acidobacteria bacterium]|nr:hypothetical protein [Acidobacteriota bacterium]